MMEPNSLRRGRQYGVVQGSKVVTSEVARDCVFS